MPELPEVEHFRQILLPLVFGSKTASSSSNKVSSIVIECPPPPPTKRFPSQDVIDLINQGCYAMKDVLRKGKVLCVILEKQNISSSGKATKKRAAAGRTKKAAKPANQKPGENENDAIIPMITGDEPTLYLSLHMGMTGRISSPDHVPRLESLSENDAYPPPHTHMIIRESNGEEAAFSDPRRFGSVLLDVGVEGSVDSSIPTFQDIAMDALEASKAYCTTTQKEPKDEEQQPTIVEQLMNRKKGIKGLLLDQRAVISGVGNWVADEVLYRSSLHPDQSYLTMTEAEKLVEELYHVLSTAVTCLNAGDDFPEEWLFHRRWRNSGGGGNAKDFNGKSITFIQSGGRSTAIVLVLQKNMSRKRVSQAKKPKAKVSKKPKNGKKKSTEELESQSKAQLENNKEATKAANKPNSSTVKSSKAQGQKRKHVEGVLPEPETQPTRRSKRRVGTRQFYANA